MVILDPYTVRLEKGRGGRLVQPAHFTSEKTEVQRGGKASFWQRLDWTQGFLAPGSVLPPPLSAATPGVSFPLPAPPSPVDQTGAMSVRNWEEAAPGIKGQCLHPGTPSFGSSVMLQRAGSY